MTIDTSAKAGPLFCKRNYVNADTKRNGTFLASSNQSLFERIIDGDPLSYWQGSTADDAVTETLTLTLHPRAVQQSVSLDMILFQNINWKNFHVEYSNAGGAYATVTGGDYRAGTADLADGTVDFLLNPSAFTADTLRISIYRTQGSATNKKLGGLIATAGVVQTRAMDSYEVAWRETIRETILGNGARSVAYILRSALSYQLWEAALGFSLIPTADRDLLKAIKDEGLPFVCWPEPAVTKREVYSCLFRGGWAERYTSTYKGAGYSLACNVSEVGPGA